MAKIEPEQLGEAVTSGELTANITVVNGRVTLIFPMEGGYAYVFTPHDPDDFARRIIEAAATVKRN